MITFAAVSGLSSFLQSSQPHDAGDGETTLLMGIIITVGLLLLNSFFVATEFAIVAIRRSRVEEMVSKGVRGSRALRRVLDDLDRNIAGAQVGVTLASVGLGIVGEPILARALSGAFQSLPGPLNAIFTHGVSSAIAFVFITYLTVVLSEALPKSVALRFAERTALILVRPLQFTMMILSPFVSLVNGSTTLLLKILRLPLSQGHTITPDELRYVVEQAEKSGVMGEHAADVVRGALRFPNTLVRQVMVHRKDVEMIDAGLPAGEVYKAAGRMRHSRVPVYKTDRERITGVLHIKELLKHDPGSIDVSNLLRPPLWVTADTPIPELVNVLRRRRTRIALVTDEFGAFAGLVTLEDAAEVVLGEVLDEHESPRAPIPRDAQGRFVVTGATRLLDLQDELEHEFSERAVTVGGFLMRFLGRAPENQEKVQIEGFEFDVEGVQGTQIAKILCRKIEAPADSGEYKSDG